MLNKCVWRFLIFGIVATARTAASSIPPVHFCNDDVPDERAHFGELLAHNPNHFGNSPESGQQPIVILANDTTYEELRCVGFNPHLNLLSATIEVKLPTGFNGDLCTNGSLEYVRFWVNYGAGWNDLGYATVNTHDIKNSRDCREAPTKPLTYTLTIKFDPDHENCTIPVLPKIRATLSWNVLPSSTDPYWSPVWGNSVEEYIQSLAKSTTPPTVITTGMELDKIIDDDPFFGFPRNCHDTSTVDEQASTTKQTAFSISPGQNLLSGDPQILTTRWEQLTCLGLDWGLSSLVATVRVKQPSGYRAVPCDNQAFEYVSFWADWNNTCEWNFLGTVRFNVHDFSKQFPAEGLVYTAVMPVDVLNFSTSCQEPKIGRVRAALSYSLPPPVPPALPDRGNFVEAHVHLQPYTGIVNPTAPQIRTIGNILISQIETLATSTGMTIPNAQFLEGAFADPSTPHDRKCPFGGLIIIRGDPILGHSYRLMARRYPPPSPTYAGLPVTHPITVSDVQNILNPFPTYDPDTDGYFNYLETLNNFENILSFWLPPAGVWQIRLEMATQGLPHVHEEYTDWYKVLVNDQGPTAHLDLTGTGGEVCGDLTVGTTVAGTFDAVSPYFDQYSFELSPSGLNPNPITLPSSIGDALTPVPPPGSTWSLTTNRATPCGYVVTLHVRDRTVLNSDPNSRFHVDPQKGFCLRRA